MDSTLIFAIVAGIIAIGFAGQVLFKKTGVPIFIFLILIGIILGPVLGIFPREALIPGLSVFAVFTLTMVLFYNGLNIKFNSILADGGRALVQVVIYVFASIAFIGVLVNVLLQWDLLSSFIFASMVGGEITAAVILPLSQSLKLKQTTISFLTLESALNSILCIMVFFGLVSVYQGTGYSSGVLGIAMQLFIGLLIGGALSLVWIFLLNRFRKQKFIYVLTLGLVLVTYALTAILGGNGQLAVLIFGVIFTNYSLLNKLPVNNFTLNMDSIKRRLIKFQEEISFLMETLFFVFLGLTFILTTADLVDSLIVGLILLAGLMATRAIATTVSTYKSELSKERTEIILMCAQGLTPATLAILAVNLQLPLANDFLNLVTYIIILTNIVATIGSVVIRHRRKLKFGEFKQGLESHLKLNTNGQDA